MVGYLIFFSNLCFVAKIIIDFQTYLL